MAHTICLQSAMASMNIDSYNRVAIHSADLDNGSLVALTSQGLNPDGDASALYNEVWTAIVPDATHLTDLWLVRSPEVTIDNHAYVSGDMRDFYNPAKKPFDVKRLSKGDIIVISAEGMAGTQGTNTYAVAVAGSTKWNWAAAPIADGFSAKLIGALTLPRNPSVAAFKFEVVQI